VGREPLGMGGNVPAMGGDTMRGIITDWICRVCERHLALGHLSTFDVCDRWLCWLAWRIENWLYFRLYPWEKTR